MPSSAPTPVIRDDGVFAVTDKANRELKSANTTLSPDELQLIVLLDGFSSVSEIAARMPGTTRERVFAAMQKLVEGKYAVSTTEEPDVDPMGSGFSTIAVPAGFFSGLANAGKEADGGLAILKKKGYYVRIARRRSPAREGDEAKRRFVVLGVDDDPDMQKLVRTYLAFENLQHRAAHNRDEIVAALRVAPAPDLILLDVQLPDTNGFDVLTRMREHPVLKNLPVIMLTAETTREAVLKGLQGGADGYVTKPFEPDALMTAVKAVLGLLPDPDAKKKEAEAKKKA